MESGLIIQLLVVAGILAYGVRSASQKSKKDADKSLHRMPGGENFPFPVSEPGFPLRRESADLTDGEELSVDEGRLQYRNAVQTDLTDGGAVASVTFEEEDRVEEQELPQQAVAETPFVVTDLRTMIISSELLKPKYEEY